MRLLSTVWRRTSRTLAQGYPCLILSPPSSIHPSPLGLGWTMKDRVLDIDWNDSEWFVEWLTLARQEGNNQKVVA